MARNSGRVAHLVVPGVGSQADLFEQTFREKVEGSLVPGVCELAFFPYSSASIPLDLITAVLDKLHFASLRPQVRNISLAIQLFLRRYDRLVIICHSHGALLVRDALKKTGLGLGTADGDPRVTVHSFGPASLVPYACGQYKVLNCTNYIHPKDIVVQTGILDLPGNLRQRVQEQQEPKLLLRFRWGSEEFVLDSRRLLNSPLSAFQEHYLYQYQEAIGCQPE